MHAQPKSFLRFFLSNSPSSHQKFSKIPPPSRQIDIHLQFDRKATCITLAGINLNEIIIIHSIKFLPFPLSPTNHLIWQWRKCSFKHVPFKSTSVQINVCKYTQHIVPNILFWFISLYTQTENVKQLHICVSNIRSQKWVFLPLFALIC